MQHQQNQQQQQRAAAAQAQTPSPPPNPISSPAAANPLQCSNCNQKLNWCQSCNTFNPTPAALLARTPPPPMPMAPPLSSDSLSGKKTPMMVSAAMTEQQHTNRLKRTREAMAAAEDLFG